MTEAEKAYQYFVIAVPENEEQVKAYFWAMKALQPTLTQPNEGARDKNVPTNKPLTLDDLRKIDTVTPLWVHDLSWGRHKPRLMLVRYVASHYWSCVDFDGFEIVKADDYGSRYLIYRRPPEGNYERTL